MDQISFRFRESPLIALGSGALWWPDQNLLCVSDLHLGKSDRLARRGAGMLPPYETRDTLIRLQAAIDITAPKTIVCLGDSFDDLAAADSLTEADRMTLSQMQAGRQWVWIEGNHDPGPVEFGGEHVAEMNLAGLTFRHIAQTGAVGEISGHYHPKARVSVRGRSISRPAFLVDENRLIMPAFGTYTGGLWSSDPAFSGLMKADAKAILTGKTPHMIPMPRN